MDQGNENIAERLPVNPLYPPFRRSTQTSHLKAL